jgi:hypothetical protein
MLDMAAVQAVVDSKSRHCTKSKCAGAERIIVGNMFAVALSNFTMVVGENNPSDVQGTKSNSMETMEQYLDGRYDGEIPKRREKSF